MLCIVQGKKRIETRQETENTHRTANLRGWNIRGGKIIKHMHIEKQTRAPMLHPAKINMRSHRDTVHPRTNAIS